MCCLSCKKGRKEEYFSKQNYLKSSMSWATLMFLWVFAKGCVLWCGVGQQLFFWCICQPSIPPFSSFQASPPLAYTSMERLVSKLFHASFLPGLLQYFPVKNNILLTEQREFMLSFFYFFSVMKIQLNPM